MAKQKSIVKLKGTMGGISFYKSRDGYLAREKGGVDAVKIKNSSAFERTRENNAEFGEAVRAVDLLLKAFREIVADIDVREYRGRLMKQMLKVVRMDTVNVRGQRKVLNENIELLQGFEFSKHNSFNKTFNIPYGIELYEFEEDFWLLEYYNTVAPFIPGDMIVAPGNATHYRILSAGGQIDFENNTYAISSWNDWETPLNSDLASIAGVYEMNQGINMPVFLLLRPAFYQQINGRFYPLKVDSYMAASLLFVKKSVEYDRKVW